MDMNKLATDIEAQIEAATRAGKQPSKAQIEDMRSWPQRMADGELHPWYGPCDGMGPAGACSECGKSQFPSEARWLTWLRTPQTQDELHRALGRAYTEVVGALRYVPNEYRQAIVECALAVFEPAEALGAVDPHVTDTGKPSTRD